MVFRNDLIHGSWWFVLGSILVVLSSAIIVANRYQRNIGSDDSKLSTGAYTTTWVLIAVSGVFYTLGSLGFVRAMNDPPMKPMFSWYHLSTDELFATWMFFVGTVLLLPYCLVLLISEGSKLIVFMVFLLVIVIALQYIWVTTCYPSSDNQVTLFHLEQDTVISPYCSFTDTQLDSQQRVLRLLQSCCCCCRFNCCVRVGNKHLATGTRYLLYTLQH